MSAAPCNLHAINMDTHQYSPPLHAASHEQPWTWCLVALVGAFIAPSLVLLPTWQVHQDLGIIGTHLFHTPPLTTTPDSVSGCFGGSIRCPSPSTRCFFWCSQFDVLFKSYIFCTPPLMNNLGLDVRLPRWERLLSIPVSLALLLMWPLWQCLACSSSHQRIPLPTHAASHKNLILQSCPDSHSLTSSKPALFHLHHTLYLVQLNHSRYEFQAIYTQALSYHRYRYSMCPCIQVQGLF